MAGVSGPEGLLVLGRPGWASVGFWAATWLFAALSVAALVATGRTLLRGRGPGRVVRAASFVVALACVTVLLFLGTWGVIGLRTWTS